MFLQIINQNFRNCTFFAARNEKSDMQKTTKGSINAHKRLRAWVFILIRHPWKKFGLMFNVVFQIYAKIRLRILFSWWLIDNRKLRKYKKKRKHSTVKRGNSDHFSTLDFDSKKTSSPIKLKYAPIS